VRIVDVDPASPLFGYVRPGYRVVAVNGSEILDAIDFRFKTADRQVNVRFADPRGHEFEFRFDDPCLSDLGLTLDDCQVKTCGNKCIFCFVHQQPKGMRRALYVKDEDYRLSFLHGNFVTLSNTTEEDIKRIIGQRLSPLYVSVHATDDKLRRCIFRNEKLPPILPRLKQLTRRGITIHTQVVVCPGVNDGEHLEKTVDDLAALAPGVASLAVVPVGLTKYRDRLPKLRTHSPDEAGSLIEYVTARQREFLKNLHTRFVWAADEFYVLAAREFPRISEYEEMPQFENGIGMVRHFITMFNRRRRTLKGRYSKRRALFLTGTSAHPFLSRRVFPFIIEELGLKASLRQVSNRFWGDTVTVSGLLTGHDLLRSAQQKSAAYDVVVLPPNCLNADDLFLDDLSLSQFEAALGKPVAVGRYNLAETIREVFI